MNCSIAESQLSAYLDGELPPAEQAAVAAHLGQCPRCAAALRSLKAAVALVANLPRQPAPKGFPAQVLDRLGQARETRDLPRPRPVHFHATPVWVRLPRYAAAAVILLAVGLLGYVALVPRDQSTERPERPSAAPAGPHSGRLYAFRDPRGEGGDRDYGALAVPEAAAKPKSDGGRPELGEAAVPADAFGDDLRMKSRVAPSAAEPLAVPPPAATFDEVARVEHRTDDRYDRFGPGLGAKDMLDKGAAAADAQTRLVWVPVTVVLKAADVQQGEQAVRSALVSGKWLSEAPNQEQAQRTGGGAGRGGAPATLTAVVPEAQMAAFREAVFSLRGMNVAMAEGEPRVIGGEPKPAEEREKDLHLTRRDNGPTTRPATVARMLPDTPPGRRGGLALDLADGRAAEEDLKRAQPEASARAELLERQLSAPLKRRRETMSAPESSPAPAGQEGGPCAVAGGPAGAEPERKSVEAQTPGPVKTPSAAEHDPTEPRRFDVSRQTAGPDVRGPSRPEDPGERAGRSAAGGGTGETLGREAGPGGTTASPARPALAPGVTPRPARSAERPGAGPEPADAEKKALDRDRVGGGPPGAATGERDHLARPPRAPERGRATESPPPYPTVYHVTIVIEPRRLTTHPAEID